MSKEIVAFVESLIADGLNDSEVSRAIGCHSSAIRKIRLGRHTHQQIARGEKTSFKPQQKAYMPTPEEIEAACFALRMARPEDDTEGWVPPGCDVVLGIG